MMKLCHGRRTCSMPGANLGPLNRFRKAQRIKKVGEREETGVLIDPTRSTRSYKGKLASRNPLNFRPASRRAA